MKHYLLTRIALAGIIASIISSCASVHYLSIEVLQPAKVSLPSHIQKVVLINQCYVRNYCSVTDFEGKINLKFDSIFSTGHVMALDEYLQNSPRLKVLRIYNASASAKKEFNLHLADSICDQTGADAAIILNKASVTKYGGYYKEKGDSTKSNKEKYSKPVAIVSIATWKLYDLKSKKIVDIQIIKDSINLVSDKWELYNGQSDQPSFWDMLYNASFQSGYTYGKRIAQEWSSEQRYIYTIPEYEFNLALKLVEKKKWDEAIALWQKFINSNNKQTASLASFNIAVGCEANDQISEALEWASKSYLLKRNEATAVYISQLEKRLKNKYTIMRQINGGKELE